MVGIKTIKANQIFLLINTKLWKPVLELKDQKFLKYKYLISPSKPESVEGGGFPFIYIEGDDNHVKYVKIGSGIIRPTPIFYKCESGVVYVTDNIYNLLNKDVKFDLRSFMEFLSFGYVLSNRTLLKNIYTLEAGQILEYKNGALRIFDQNIYDFVPVVNFGNRELLDKLWDISLQTFRELISSIKGTIVVPLSSGFDSRFVVAMLKLLKCKNVICINYGIKRSYETLTSKKAAEKLGYEWHFIEYSNHNLQSLFKSKEFLDYVKKTSQYQVTPNIQEFLSSYILREKYDHHKNLTFMPGHTGDFISGGHINKYVVRASDLKEVAESIIRKHLLRNYPGPRESLMDVIAYLSGYLRRTGGKLVSYQLYEIFDWRERQSKYIISSTKPYEHFGFTWSVPLWSKRFFDFWSSVPLNFKYDKKLYNQFLAEYIFAPLGIDFEKNSKQIYRSLNITRRFIGDILGRTTNRYRYVNPCGLDTLFPYIMQYSKIHHPRSFRELNFIKKHYGIEGYVEPAAYMNDLTATLIINDLEQYSKRNITELLHEN